MNETVQPNSNVSSTTLVDSERTKHVTVAGYVAGCSAFFALGALTANPSWPVSAGVAAVAVMVAVVCYFILK